MTRSGSLEFLQGIEGTEVTFHSSSETESGSPFHFPPQTWVITEKLSEDSVQMTQKDIDDGLGPSFTAGNFLCHRTDDATKIAFMRIYLQVPIAGTEFQDSRIRGRQAAPPLWDKVPGQSLNMDTFWDLDPPTRQAIRAKFRDVYEKLVRCGYQPRMATSSKIIFDKSTGTMHISGFGRACPIDPYEKWSDSNYVMYGLAMPGPKPHWYLDSTDWTW